MFLMLILHALTFVILSQGPKGSPGKDGPPGPQVNSIHVE